MNFSELFIRRPIATLLLTISITLFGIAVFRNLPVNDLPAVDYPVIQVTVGYPGASPETMANTVATPLEKQFLQIPGLSLVTSRNQTGQSVLVLQLDSIALGSRTYNIQTDQYKKQGSSRGKNTAEKVGGGAIIGGIIGAIAGGGKGAAIGAAAGGGVGGGVQAATKSQQIKLPSETVLNFTLQAPVTVVKAPNPSSNRPKLSDSQ